MYKKLFLHQNIYQISSKTQIAHKPVAPIYAAIERSLS